MANDWITMAEAAEVSGYHPDHVRRLIRDGHLKAQQFGIVWQISRSSLQAYVRKAEQKGERRGPKPKIRI